MAADAGPDAALAAAAWLGQRGGAVFAVGGLLVVLSVWLVAATWRHGALAHADGRLAPMRWLALRVAAALGAIGASAAVFAAIASAIGVDRAVGRLDDAYAAALATALSPVTVDALAWATHLGDAAVLTAIGIGVALVLVALRQRGEAVAWVVAVGGQGIVTRMLKAIFERVRPVHDARFAVDGYSFPSGHTSGATVVYGMLAWLVMRHAPPRWHLPALLVGAALAWTTGISRIALQVHHPSDVVAGFATGALWLVACVFGAAGVRWRMARRPHAGAATTPR